MRYLALLAIALLASCTTYENMVSKPADFEAAGVGDSEAFTNCFISRMNDIHMSMDVQTLRIVPRSDRTTIMQDRSVVVRSPLYIVDVIPTSTETYSVEYRSHMEVGEQYRVDRAIVPCLETTKRVQEATQ